MDEIVSNNDVNKYIKSKLGQFTSDIDFKNPILNEQYEDPMISQEVTENHHGLDIVSSRGDDVLASAAGKVLYTGVDSIYGNIIILSHQDNFYTFYGHLDAILVNSHDFVTSNQVIGYVGDSGEASGPHLHFEIWSEDGLKNPRLLIKGL